MLKMNNPFKFKNCFSNFPSTPMKCKNLKWFNTDIPSRSHFTPYNDEINYNFNSKGYRCPEFDEDGFHVLAIGCSRTFGIGVPEERRYSNVLGKSISEDAVVWNMAWPGSSTDYLSRIVMLVLPLLKIDLLVTEFTYMARREFFDIDGDMYDHRVNRLTETPQEKHIKTSFNNLSSNYNDAYNFLRNYKIVEGIVSKHQVKWLFSVIEQDLPKYNMVKHLVCDEKRVSSAKDVDKARDGGHIGPETHLLHGNSYYRKYKEQYA